MGSKIIQLWDTQHSLRRLILDSSARTFSVEVRGSDGRGFLYYMPSGLHAEDGIEIWTPARWQLTVANDPLKPYD